MACRGSAVRIRLAPLIFPRNALGFQVSGGGSFAQVVMALIPRWQYMSDSSKAIVKNVAGTALVLVIGLLLLRAFFGWIVLAVLIWAGWKLLNRR